MILVNIRCVAESHYCGDKTDKIKVIISLIATVPTQTLVFRVLRISNMTYYSFSKQNMFGM